MKKLKSFFQNLGNFPLKIKITLIIMGVIILALLATLVIIITTKDKIQPTPQEDNNTQQEEEKEKTGEPKSRTTILDIPSLTNKDAFEILDILIAEYGEPNPQGLIKVLKEFRDIHEPSFQTVTWVDIKYGYNFTFNFWTDGSLARKDSYYITGYKRNDHTIDEILKLTNLSQNNEKFVFNIIDLGGETINVGITPIEAAQKPDLNEDDETKELTKEEILKILKENADKKWKNEPARAKLEYENQVEAYEWIQEQTQYLDLMEKAKKEWGVDYVMVKWEYEKEVRAYEATLK